MRLRHLTSLLCLMTLGSVAGHPGDTKPTPSECFIGSQDATPLHELDSAEFSDGGFLAWMGPPRCDEDGDVFLLLLPQWSQRSAKDSLTTPRGPASN